MKQLRKTINIAMDMIEAVGVIACSIVVYPLMSLIRSPRRLILSSKFLAPRAQLGLYLQAKFCLVVGQNGKSVMSYSHLIKSLEEDFDRMDILSSPELKRFAINLYEELMGVHMSMGDLDQAATILLRAHKHIGCDFLPAYGDFNVHVAHIVKAGIAAGKVLDDESIKGLFDSGRSIIIRAGNPDSEFIDAPEPQKTPQKPGKVIPFRRPEPVV